MPRDDAESGAAAWGRRWWRALLAEVVATALLVWLGIAAMMPLGKNPQPLVHPAFAFGGVVVGLAMCFGPTSGAHMNPAVTLAALLHGRIAPAAAAAYALAQTGGGLLGFAALLAVTPADATEENMGCTKLGPGVTPAAALIVEAALTGLLALGVCGAWAAHDDARPDHTVPLKLGLLIAGLICAGGTATGASLNPARSLAPAVLHGFWDHHWVYWVGPLAGAALGALLHRHVLMSPAPPSPVSPRSAEEVPLQDKP